MTRLVSAIFPFLLGVVLIAGCASHEDARPAPSPSATSTSSMPPLPLTALPLSMSVGLQASYGYGPSWPTLRPVNFTVAVQPNGAFLHTYRYNDCGSCAGDIQYRMASDGSWTHAEFACQPPFPDTRAKGCITEIGGWSDRDGLRGPFFGLALIAGLPISPEGTVSRSFVFGTTTLNASFVVHQINVNTVEISAVPSNKDDPFRVGFEPDGCDIFRGRVVVNLTLALPEACWNDEASPDNGSRESFGWMLKWTNAKPGSARFAPTGLPGLATLHPDGARFPPRQDDDALPFGLYEALEQAVQKEPRIQEFLDRPDVALSSSSLQNTGAIRTGDCTTACLSTDYWKWDIAVRSGKDGIGFEITKEVTTPGGLIMYEDVKNLHDLPSADPLTNFPTQQPHPLAWFWQQAETSAHVQPVVIAYQAAVRHGSMEPFVSVGFAAEHSGYQPTIWYRNDGTVQLWIAKGAVAPP